MCLPTFIDWFFGWASRMKIDFRQGCIWCEGKPAVLACDGTKIGTNFKNTFVDPIETSEMTTPIDNKLRRHDRCFLFNPNKSEETARQYANARDFLEVLSRSVITAELDHNQTEVAKRLTLMSLLPENSRESFLRMIDGDTPRRLQQAYGAVFKLLANDASLDTVLPLRICHDSIKFVELVTLDLHNDDFIHDFVFRMKYFCIEFSQLINTSIQELQCISVDILQLLQYCCEFVIEVHTHDIPAELP